jgi:hypothetical protein
MASEAILETPGKEGEVKSPFKNGAKTQLKTKKKGDKTFMTEPPETAMSPSPQKAAKEPRSQNSSIMNYVLKCPVKSLFVEY